MQLRSVDGATVVVVVERKDSMARLIDIAVQPDALKSDRNVLDGDRGAVGDGDRGARLFFVNVEIELKEEVEDHLEDASRALLVLRCRVNHQMVHRARHESLLVNLVLAALRIFCCRHNQLVVQIRKTRIRQLEELPRLRQTYRHIPFAAPVLRRGPPVSRDLFW